MENKSQLKGKSLEDAVAFIESYIFSSNPKMRESDISMERNKIVDINGARNEIDLFIETDLGNGYKSVFIFECKYWDNKIDKNEVIIFSEKVKGVNAQKGFIVGKSFTADALKRAENDGKIEVVLLKDEFDVDINAIPLHYYSPSIEKANIIVFGKELEGVILGPDDTFLLENTEIKLFDLVNKLSLDLQTEIYNSNPIIMLQQHSFEKEKEFEFEKKALTFKGKKVFKIKLNVFLKITKLTPFIKSKFDVEKRGRHYNIEFRDEQNKLTTTFGYTHLK